MSARRATTGTSARGFDAQTFLESAGFAKRIVLHEQNKLADRFIPHMVLRNVRIEQDLIDQLFNSSSLLSVVLHD